MKKVMLVMALLGAMQVSAQNVKVDDKEIIGTWVMESIIVQVAEYDRRQGSVSDGQADCGFHT